MVNKKPITVTANKTARTSLAGIKDEPFKASGDLDRIIPLDNGKWAYLRDPRDGRTHHLLVGSEAWNSLIFELSTTEHGPHIQKELERLGW